MRELWTYDISRESTGGHHIESSHSMVLCFSFLCAQLLSAQTVYHLRANDGIEHLYICNSGVMYAHTWHFHFFTGCEPLQNHKIMCCNVDLILYLLIIYCYRAYINLYAGMPHIPIARCNVTGLPSTRGQRDPAQSGHWMERVGDAINW